MLALSKDDLRELRQFGKNLDESTPRTEASRPDRSFRLSRFSAGPVGERVLAAAVPAETPAIRRPPASPPLAGARRRRMLCFES